MRRVERSSSSADADVNKPKMSGKRLGCSERRRKNRLVRIAPAGWDENGFHRQNAAAIFG